MSHHKGSATIINISPNAPCAHMLVEMQQRCKSNHAVSLNCWHVLCIVSLLLLFFFSFSYLIFFLLHALVAPSLIRMLSYDHVLVTHTVMSKPSPMQIRISPFRIRRMLRPPTVAQRLANRKSGHQCKRANPQCSEESKELAASTNA